MSIENDVDNLIDNLIDRIAECCDFSSEIDDSRSINDNDSNRDECGENVKINPEELDRKNPAYVPKRGGFYEHDPRFEKSDDAKLDGNRAKTPSSSKTYVDKLRKWKHDMFDVQEQSPKSRNELFHEYGFDVQRNNDQNKQALPRYRGDDRRNGARYPKKFPTPVVSDNCQQQSNFRSSGFEQKQHYPENRPRSDIPFKKALNPRAERRDDDHSFRNINRVDATHRDEIKQVDHPVKKKDDFPIPKMEFRRRIVVNSEYAAVEQRPHQRYNIPPRFAKNARNFGSSKNTLPTPSNNNRTLALEEEEEEDVAEIEEDLGENSESSIQFANDYEAAAAQEQIVRTSQTPPSSGQQHPKRYSAMRQQQYSNTPPPQTATTPPATSTVLPSMQQLHATAPPFMPQQQQPLAAYGQQQIFDGIDFQQQQYAAAGMMAPPPYVPPNYGAPPGVLQQYAYQQLLNSLIIQQQQHEQMFVADQLAPHTAYYQVANQQQTPVQAPMLVKTGVVAAPPVDPCSSDGRRN